MTVRGRFAGGVAIAPWFGPGAAVGYLPSGVLQMNAPNVNIAEVARALSTLRPPPPAPRHPRMRELQASIRGVVSSLDATAEAVGGLVPEKLYGDEGLLVSEDRLRDLAPLADLLLTQLRGKMWRPIQRDAARYFPALGQRLHATVDRTIDLLHSFLLMIDLMVGTGYAAREGVSFEPVPPDAPESDEQIAGLTDEQIAGAEARARRDDGTMDAFSLAIEMSKLLPSDPAAPHSDDEHFRFRRDPQMLRVARRHG